MVIRLSLSALVVAFENSSATYHIDTEKQQCYIYQMNGNNYLLESTKRLNLKHKDLAEKGGLSVGMISQMQRGRRRINIENALKLYIGSGKKLSIKKLNPNLHDLLVDAGLLGDAE